VHQVGNPEQKQQSSNLPSTTTPTITQPITQLQQLSSPSTQNYDIPASGIPRELSLTIYQLLEISNTLLTSISDSVWLQDTARKTADILESSSKTVVHRGSTTRKYCNSKILCGRNNQDFTFSKQKLPFKVFHIVGKKKQVSTYSRLSKA
jgi:hypothetical protein